MSIDVPIGHSSVWNSPDQNLELERTSATNSVRVTIQETVEISANVVPVTEEEDAIHSYGIPKNDSFAHLEVQFRFFDLSPKVEGILGRTYQPSFTIQPSQGPYGGCWWEYLTEDALAAVKALLPDQVKVILQLSAPGLMRFGTSLPLPPGVLHYIM
ncbi:hypothetical protein HAX54_034098 [Datura stramonium]|uniref:Uncharacterized protein n=1 Tax=Datura stramonium TaxID=4076 RepID=A0ABS8VEH0_DATST|nr:hypothetical protein [Datura stramonium]